MKILRIDKLGRIVVPMHYRKILNITAETDLIIDCDGQKMSISPIKRTCKLCEKIIEKSREIQLCDECISKIKQI